MVGKKNIRSYEVSIWTLQDSFITVLKPLNLEHKGAIQDGKITLQDDGENRISFSIPMYIREKGDFIENPLWYNTEDGNLIANLRKLKVIFNKKTVDERVFEFIITKVTENHEGFEKICEIEGESLAFNELGKQGYKISLSEDDLYNEVSDELDALKADDSTEGISVKNNINYWIDKVLIGTNWKYSIQMDWSIVDGIIDQYEEGATRYSDLTEEQRATLNFNRESNGLRRHDRIYEDAYVSSWSISNNALIPAAVVESTEKLRMVEGNESNRYNLLQSIAEAFEVYTKYKYYYDKNYHIIGREVIFYNNFLDEDNTIDLTYDYDTQSISRELDAADIVTKMYVKTLDDESYPSGLASIMDTKANKTGEDYILNFDYLYDIKTISEEQYAAIKVFEKNIANLNNQIKPLDNSIIKLESKLIDREVARDNALAMMKEAEENINFITEQLKAITEDSNYSSIVTVVKENPAFIFLSKGKNNYLGEFGSQFSGIVPGTVEVYSDSNCTIPVAFSQKIKNNMVQNLIFTNTVGKNVSNGYLYAIFAYRPALEKEKLQEDYQTLYNKNKKIYEKNLSKASEIENSIKTKKATRENLYANKTKLISDFENTMGPALREGNWQPEDEYVGYGDQYDENIQPSYSNSAISTTSKKLKFIWDQELFDEEEENYYEYGINQQKVYYPCIDLTKINSNIFEKLKEEEFRNGLSFVYKNPNETNPYLLPQGTNCKFAFIKSTSDDDADIIPVLMIINLYNEINIVNNTSANNALEYLQSLTSYIAYITDISIILSTITVDNSTIFSVPPGAWIEYPNNYNIVYPRLEIQSDSLKTEENELFLNIYREKANPTGQGTVYTYIDKLEEFTDYSIFSRNEKKYITIKPEVLLAGKIGEAKIKINYCLANTALQIYLDAIEVMKENAYPKVSYTISQLFSPKLFYNTYDRLGQLAHINDVKLKFKNVMGYISAVELNLDKPWEDSITIQNYKNKFEDLFSTIVAQTEDMKKNAYRINAAANAFSADGLLIAELAPDSILKSARIINNLIKQNADVIAAKAIGEAARDKAALASTDAYRIMHGEVGLAFKGNKIDSVVLNQDKGLIIAGTTGTGSSKKNVFFRLDNAEMGFFQGTPDNLANATPQLHYENGNLALSGVMYAASGWFGGDNGWIIGSNKLSSNITEGLGGLLYSANGKAIFTSLGGGDNKTDPMVILTKTGFSLDKQNAALLFDGTNLYVNGTITANAGYIGNWKIDGDFLYSTSLSHSNGWDFSGNGIVLHGTKDNGEIYIYNKNENETNVIGRLSGNYSNGVLFKIGYDDKNYLDYSLNDGLVIKGNITATSGTFTGTIIANNGRIGGTNGWYIESGYIGNASTLTNSTVGMYQSTTASDIVFWAGNKTKTSAPFSVTAGGALTATAGAIGNWKIEGNFLYSASLSHSNGWDFAGNGIVLYGASDNGEIYIYHKTGNTTSVVGRWSGTYSDNVLFKIGTDDNNYLNYSITDGLSIKGNIIATSGTFTGTINANEGRIGSTTAKQIILEDGVIRWNRTKIDDTEDKSGFYLSQDGLFIGKKNKFKVTAEGVLTATGAEISGALTATTLSTGNRKTKSTGTAGTFIDDTGAIYVGSTNAFTVTAAGKVTATDAVLSGSLTAGENFSVTSAGVLTAKKGSIGGWTIGSNYIGTGTTRGNSAVGMSNYTTGSNDDTRLVFWAGNPNTTGAGVTLTTANIPFSVNRAGVLRASGAIISGEFTATSLTVGDSTVTAMTYTSADGLQIGTGDNYLKYNDSGLEIKGSINATKGTIGDLTLSNSGIYSKPDRNGRRLRLTGLTGQETPLAIGAIDTDNDGVWNWGLAPFRVDINGAMYASNVNITGGEIKLFDSEKISYTAYDEVFNYDYEGTISLNQKHSETIEDITRTIPFTLYLHEKINYGKDEETGKDILTNYKMFYHEGELELRETGQSGTLISASRISSQNFSTNNIDISGDSISIDSGSLGIEMIAESNNSGLKTYDEDKWIIRKNINGEIYIDGIVHVRNSAGEWVVISG